MTALRKSPHHLSRAQPEAPRATRPVGSGSPKFPRAHLTGRDFSSKRHVDSLEPAIVADYFAHPGSSGRDIAARVGCTADHVRRVLAFKGLPLRRPGIKALGRAAQAAGLTPETILAMAVQMREAAE